MPPVNPPAYRYPVYLKKIATTKLEEEEEEEEEEVDEPILSFPGLIPSLPVRCLVSRDNLTRALEFFRRMIRNIRATG